MASQTIIFLLLFGGVQGLLLLAFFLNKKWNREGNNFLFFYLSIMLLQILFKVLNKAWLMENTGFLYSVAHYFALLYGPFLFFFLSKRAGQNPSAKKVTTYLVPFFIMMTAIFVMEVIPSFNFISWPFNPYVRLALVATSIIYYHIASLKLVEHSGQETVSIDKDEKLFYKQFVYLSACVCLAIATAQFLLYINHPNGHGYRYFFVVLTFFIYWVSSKAIQKPGLFQVIKGNGSQVNEYVPRLTVHRPVKKYASSTLSEPEKNRICDALSDLMDGQRLYLDTTVTIDTLAIKAGTSRHFLSQVLNERLQLSFNDYINRYRVEAAKKLLTDPANKHYTIAAIAFDSGFNAISTFNEVFKKAEGQTPSEYKKSVTFNSREQRV